MTARHFNERWTEEEKQQLLGLVAKGMTYREMGKALGKSWGAVSGKIERMGLCKPRQKKAKRKLVGAARGRPPQETLPVACTEPPWGAGPGLDTQPEENRPAPLPSPVVARPSAALWAPKTCQFPIGDVGDAGFHFCGAPITEAGKSYCPDHHARCYMGRPKKAPGEGLEAGFKQFGWGGYR